MRGKVVAPSDPGQHGDGPHSGSATGLKIVAAVADHRHPCGVKVKLAREGKAHSRAGFGTVTGIIARDEVKAVRDPVVQQMLAGGSFGIVGRNPKPQAARAQG